jgi:putative tricarboxylic transport membrane protein
LKRDHIIIVCTVALSAVYLYETLQIPSLDTVDPLGPRAYPYLVFGGLLVSAIWLFLETAQKAKIVKQAEENSAEESAPVEKKHTIMLAAVVAWLGIYYAAIVPVGFIISSLVFLIGLTSYFNPGKWTANILTSLIFVVGFYFLFTAVLGVPLAKGLLDI